MYLKIVSERFTCRKALHVSLLITVNWFFIILMDGSSYRSVSCAAPFKFQYFRSKLDDLDGEIENLLLRQNLLKFFKILNKIIFRSSSGKCLPNSLKHKKDKEIQNTDIREYFSISELSTDDIT